MEDQATIKVFKSNILERVRQRPTMFLGKHSLSALAHFLDGYFAAQYDLGVRPATLLPEDFHDWVAYRLHFRESTSGYVNMILKHTGDEPKALARFFELLDEHRVRKARTVARIRHHPPDCKIRRQIKSLDGKLSPLVEIPCAEEVSIVVFTDDPGFFLVNDDPSCDYPRKSVFRPSLSWLHQPYQADPEFTTVVDQQQFDRLLQEAEAFEQARREESDVRQRKVREQQGKIDEIDKID